LLRRIDVDSSGKISYTTFVDALHASDKFTPTIADTEPVFRRSVSPVRKTATTSHFYSPSKKTSNLEYIDYVRESARKSRSRSP